MTTPTLLRQSDIAGKVPTTDQLALGELAVNTADGKVYTKVSVSGVESVVEVGAAAGGGGGSGGLTANLANTAITGFKTATFNSQVTLAAIAGAITVNWSTAQNQRQPEPTSTITYTFTAPPGPCHLQLVIDSDGSSTPQAINWPSSVVWFGAVWSGEANKKAIINFWFDGTSYYAMGVNQA
jgi:hypothetical protein